MIPGILCSEENANACFMVLEERELLVLVWDGTQGSFTPSCAPGIGVHPYACSARAALGLATASQRTPQGTAVCLCSANT